MRWVRIRIRTEEYDFYGDCLFDLYTHVSSVFDLCINTVSFKNPNYALMGAWSPVFGAAVHRGH